jgi:hypothetical protein
VTTSRAEQSYQLNGSGARAAGRGSDQNKLAGLNPVKIDECKIRCEVLHPNRGRLLRREVVGIGNCRDGACDRTLAIRAIAPGRNAHFLSDFGLGYAGANCTDNACGFAAAPVGPEAFSIMSLSRSIS